MNEKLFFHIGVTYSKESILQDLVADGYRIFVIDEIGIKPTVNIPYFCVYGSNYADIITLIKKIAKDHETPINDCSFFTLAEGSVDLLNNILSHFDKPLLSKHSQSLKDKYWIRKQFEEFNIEKLPYCFLAKNPAEIPSPDKNIFPLIVKPLGSMASRNVFKVYNNDDLRRSCLEIFTKNRTFITVDHGEIVIEDTYNQPAYALIETCLEGEKLSFEALVIDSELIFCATTSKFDYKNDFFYERADIVDPNFFDSKHKDLQNKYINNIIKALAIDSAILHIEVFFDRAKSIFHLIEVNFRMGGDNIHELVCKAYNVNLVKCFLDYSSGVVAKQYQYPKQISQPWIAFYFMTDAGGEFKQHSDIAFESKIIWDFEGGDKISKFSTSKFYKLGTVVFSTTQDQIEDKLKHLLEKSDLYFSINQGNQSHNLINLKKSEKGALKLLQIGIAFLYLGACFAGSFFLYRSFSKQTNLIAETMAKTLSYHLANRETYYVANIVHNFQTNHTFDQIVVTDELNRVIYSNSSEKAYSLLYQEPISLSDFDKTIPIMVDGIGVGKLVYNLNYKTIISQLTLSLILISILLSGLYFVIVKYLFTRVAASAKNEADHIISIVNKLHIDLECLHERNTLFSLEEYDQLLRSSNNDFSILNNLRATMRKLVGVLKDLRNGIVEKNQLVDLLDQSTKKLITATTQAEIAKVAARLSHDIRSPLAALKVVRDLGADKMDKDQAKLLTMSIDRITDIANTILPKNAGQTENKDNVQSSFLWMLVDQIISEKRVEYKNSNDVSIDFKFEGSPFELNASCNPTEFMRSISNIINNSIEAKDPERKLTVSVQLKSANDHITLTIADNGKGISSEILPKILDEGFSHEKSHGTGLGLYQVKKAVESWNGAIQITSIPDLETVITIQLKKTPQPSWLATSIQISSYKNMVVLDDEEYVFSILQDRFEKHFKEIQYFKRIDEFEENIMSFSESFIFVDHDLKQNMTGIDLIEKYNLQKQSILLTGNYDDKQVQQRSAELGIKILPKPLINDLPIVS